MSLLGVLEIIGPGHSMSPVSQCSETLTPRSRPMSRWYVSRDGNDPAGPFTWDQLQQMSQSGLLKTSDQVWQTGTPDWVLVGTITALLPLRPASAAPPAEAAPTTPAQPESEASRWH